MVIDQITKAIMAVGVPEWRPARQELFRIRICIRPIPYHTSFVSDHEFLVTGGSTSSTVIIMVDSPSWKIFFYTSLNICINYKLYLEQQQDRIGQDCHRLPHKGNHGSQSPRMSPSRPWTLQDQDHWHAEGSKCPIQLELLGHRCPHSHYRHQHGGQSKLKDNFSYYFFEYLYKMYLPWATAVLRRLRAFRWWKALTRFLAHLAEDDSVMEAKTRTVINTRAPFIFPPKRLQFKIWKPEG